METLDRRHFLKLTAQGVALVALTGCRPGDPGIADDPDAAEPVDPAAGPVTLAVFSWDGTDAEGMENEIIDLYRDEFAHVTVRYQFNPDAYEDKLLTALAAGTAPDIFLWWNHPPLVARGAVEDLTPYVEGPNGIDTGMYYPEILDYNRVDDGLFGLPKDFTPRACFYNAKLFDQAGLPHPTADWTWDDLIEMARELTGDDRFGFTTYIGAYPLQPYVWSRGGDFLSPDGSQATGHTDSAETIEAVEWYVALEREEGISPSAEMAEVIGGPDQMFMNDMLAIHDNGRWPQTVFKEAPDLEFGTVLPPINPTTGQRVTVLHQAGFCLNPDSEHKDGEALHLLRHLAGADAHRIRTEAGWAVPAIPDVVEALGLLDDPIEQTWFEAVPYATVDANFLRTPSWFEAEEALNHAIEASFLGQGTVADNLRQAASEVDAILAGT